MTTKATQTVLFLLLTMSMVGCQSVSRLAWWKPQMQGPQDTSMIARSAAPELPSAIASSEPSSEPTSTAPAAMVASNEPKKANSFFKWPAWGKKQSDPIVVNPTATDTQLANAPAAVYPLNTIAPNTTTQPAGESTPGFVAAAILATTPPAVSDAGPYDASAYVAASSPAATAASASGNDSSPLFSPVADRYATSTPAVDTTLNTTPVVVPMNVPPTVAQSTVPPTVAQVPANYASDDRYGPSAYGAGLAESNATPGNNSVAIAPIVNSSETISTANSEATIANAPVVSYPSTPVQPAMQNRMAAAPIASPVFASQQPVPKSPTSEQIVGSVAPVNGPAATSNAVVQTQVVLPAPAGQYRPGGTSSYPTAGLANDVLNVATRPAPASDAIVVDPNTTAAPATVVPSTSDATRYR